MQRPSTVMAGCFFIAYVALHAALALDGWLNDGRFGWGVYSGTHAELFRYELTLDDGRARKLQEVYRFKARRIVEGSRVVLHTRLTRFSRWRPVAERLCVVEPHAAAVTVRAADAAQPIGTLTCTR